MDNPHLHGGGLSSAVVSQEGDHLVFMEVQAEFVEGQFAAVFVDFGQFVDANDQRQVARLFFYPTHFLCS